MTSCARHAQVVLRGRRVMDCIAARAAFVGIDIGGEPQIAGDAEMGGCPIRVPLLDFYTIGAGGEAGQTGENALIRNGKEIPLASKGPVELQAGDIISIRTPGGGGFGEAE